MGVAEVWLEYSESRRSRFKLARRIKKGANKGIWGEMRRVLRLSCV